MKFTLLLALLAAPAAAQLPAAAPSNITVDGTAANLALPKYGKDDDHPKLGPNTIAAIQRLQTGCPRTGHRSEVAAASWSFASSPVKRLP